MAARKPKLVHYWVWQADAAAIGKFDYKVNWKLVSANNEIVSESRQGFRDKTDSRRGFDAHTAIVGGDDVKTLLAFGAIREEGPGKKPTIR